MRRHLPGQDSTNFLLEDEYHANSGIQPPKVVRHDWEAEVGSFIGLFCAFDRRGSVLRDTLRHNLLQKTVMINTY